MIVNNQYSKIIKIGLYGFVTLALLIFATLIWFKPIRVVFAHHLSLLHCEDHICVDDAKTEPLAKTLYNRSLQETQDKVGAFHQQPTMVFCSTLECANTFGMGKAAAKAVGNLGLLVAPRGWKDFYITHELIHHRQAEEWGNIAMLTKPKWLVEGMAYSLSDDPRPTLSEPFQQWRAQFKLWHQQNPNPNIWYTTGKVK
ncbi:hypothetical protein [Acinetobacter seifertii]|uniref:hypothetical protein n=1 Tax=Acinetobacter seifertii TaxID=1530123 RepID=UPI00083A855D|nr:hypothetical protein [Acinetobacter seifertii]OCZ61661.1 hypothetical protein A7P21_05790 [Acinetobacter seifertii]